MFHRLKEAFDRAQEEAERLKHEQRMKRLQKGGHSTERLDNNFLGNNIYLKSNIQCI